MKPDIREQLDSLSRWLEIDLDNLAQNTQVLRKMINKDTKFMAVLKADAYGHGAVEVAHTVLANGADSIGVGGVDEGVELREFKIDTEVPILNLFSIRPSQVEALRVIDHNLTQTIYTFEVAKVLSECAIERKKNVKIHIKIDTGLRRVGVPYREAVQFIQTIQKLPNLQIEGIFSTLAGGEDTKYTEEQFKKFQEVIKGLKDNGIEIPIKHIVSSTALLEFPHMYLDMVRLGITVYGLSPWHNNDLNLDLKPVLSFKSKVDYVKKVEKGESIGYGRTYVTQRDSIIATLPTGYYDALSRTLSNKGVVIIHGKRVPIVGTVSINHCLVDTTDVPDISKGNEVTVIGRQGAEGITVDEIASKMGTINYEVLVRLGQRVPRVYLKNQKPYKIRTIRAKYDEV